MGFFSGLFGNKIKPPAKEEWPSIVNEISIGLERVRNMWFDQCKTIAVGTNCVIKNTTLQDIGLIYAKTFQLYNSFNFIGYQKYIAPADGAYFADSLLDKVCNNDKGFKVITSEYHRKLHEKKLEPDKQGLIFASDISNFITGNARDGVALMAVAMTLPGFIGTTQMVIASSFGDNKTVKKIESKTMK